MNVSSKLEILAVLYKRLYLIFYLSLKENRYLKQLFLQNTDFSIYFINKIKQVIWDPVVAFDIIQVYKATA